MTSFDTLPVPSPPQAEFPLVKGSPESVKLRTVAIFADPLISPTLTFIPAQGKAMERFSPCYIGPQLGNADGIELPPDRTLVLSSRKSLRSRLREIRFRITQRSPGFFRKIGEFSPALVHAHFGPAAVEALDLARWLGVPLIANFHGGDATLNEEHFLHSRHYMHRRFWRMREVLAREAQLILACSNFVRAELMKKGFPEQKIRVHYVGVDTSFFAPDDTVPRDPIVLYVGSIVPSKGLNLLIDAMTEVQRILPETSLVVIGDGPLRAGLERSAGHLLRKCAFFGYQRPEFVRDWMNRARAFCVPSHRVSDGSCEGFGLVFAEAQAMGLPVVSFASGGIPEAVRDGATGVLSAPGDTRALVQNLLRVLKDESSWERMSRAGRQHVRRHFDLRKCTSNLEDDYEQVLEEQTSLNNSARQDQI